MVTVVVSCVVPKMIETVPVGVVVLPMLLTSTKNVSSISTMSSSTRVSMVEKKSTPVGISTVVGPEKSVVALASPSV